MYKCDFADIINKYSTPLYPVKTDVLPVLKRSDKIKCVIFDVYGTLIISGSGDISAHQVDLSESEERMEALLKRYSIKAYPEELHILFKKRVVSIHENLKNQGVDVPEVDYPDVWKSVTGITEREKIECFTLEYEMITNPVYEMPGAKNILSFLKKRSILAGIISNAQFFTPVILEHLLGKEIYPECFDPVLIFLSYKYRCAKPSEYIFNKAVEKLSDFSMVPHQVLYVGNDMKSDIIPAKKCGFKTALFAGDKRSLRTRGMGINEILKNSDNIITELSQIKVCI